MNPQESVEPDSGADDEKNARERTSVEDATVSTAAVRTPPGSDSQTEDLIERWWDDFEAADVEGKISLFRRQVETVQPGDTWCERVYREGLAELAPLVSDERYAAIIDEIHQSRPDLFALDLDWNIRTMVFEHVARDDMKQLDYALDYFARELKTIDEPFFSLVSLARLKGRAEPVSAVIRAALAHLDDVNLLPHAHNQVISWALFDAYEECRRAGASDEAIDVAVDRGISLGFENSPEARSNRRQLVLHFCGLSGKKWTAQELRVTGRAGRWRMVLLLNDYMRWLCEARGVQPVVADELRSILESAIVDMESEPKDLLRGLHRGSFEPVLARRLSSLALDNFHGVAALIGMRSFYDFLAESGLIDNRTHQNAQAVCGDLWARTHTAAEQQWHIYRFLEHYWLPQ